MTSAAHAHAKWTESSRDHTSGHASKSAPRVPACAKRLGVRVRSTALGREPRAGGCRIPLARFKTPSPLHPGGMTACSRWLRELGDRYHRKMPLLVSTPAGVPARKSRSFALSLLVGSLASLRDAMYVFALPVVSLRSTTGYRLSSLRDGMRCEDSRHLPVLSSPSSTGILTLVMPEGKEHLSPSAKAVLRTRTPRRFAQGGPLQIPSTLESTSRLTRRPGKRQCLMF
jgi:hypothetical protein